jgi:hypothetical protein
MSVAEDKLWNWRAFRRWLVWLNGYDGALGSVGCKESRYA